MAKPIFSTINEQVAQIKDAVGTIAAALQKEKRVFDEPGWHDILSIPSRFATFDGRPILVMCLAGPSGGGKSTIFEKLTGIKVPSGSAVRPVSYNSVLAVPSALAKTSIPAEQLPSYSVLLPLSDPGQVRDKNLPEETLLVADYDVADDGNVLSMLADIPDFNTVEAQNWSKAEKMMARADLVIFVTQADNYMDERVVDVLHRCCKYTGKLAYVITKVSGETPEQVRQNAREIWDDMVSVARDELGAFRETRADGLPLSTFLSRSEVFFAPFRPQPVISDFQSMGGDGKTLASVSMGIDAEGILLERLRQVAQGGLELGARLCDEADGRRADIQAKAETAEKLVQELAERISQSQFPLGDFLNVLIEAIRDSRPRWVRIVSVPVSLTVRAVSVPFKGIKSLIKRIRKQGPQPELKPRERLEQERLEEGSSWLLDRWRGEFPSLAGGVLSSANIASERKRFLALDHPATEQGGWEQFVRKNASAWARQHPVRTTIIGSLSDLLGLIGGVMIVVDLAMGGSGSWLVIAFDQLGLWSIGSIVLTSVLKLVEESGMGLELSEVNRRWSAQRSKEFVAHILDHFALPLFLAEWREQLTELDNAPIQECRNLCSELVVLLEGPNADE